MGSRWLAGLSVTTPSLGLFEGVSLESYTVSGAPNKPPSSLLPILFENDQAFGAESQQPAFIRAGMAFQQPSSFTFAFDMTAYAPSQYNLLPSAFIDQVLMG